MLEWLVVDRMQMTFKFIDRAIWATAGTALSGIQTLVVHPVMAFMQRLH